MSTDQAPAPATPAENGRSVPKVEVVVSVPTVVKAVALFFGILLIFIARDALLSIVLSGVLVLGLDPLVTALERRGWGRGKAALGVFAGLGLILFVLVVWTVTPLWHEIRQFVQAIPGYIDEARRSGVLSDVDDSTDLFDKLDTTASDAARELSSSALSLLGVAAELLGDAFMLVTLAFLTLFGLIAKPALTRSALELMRPATATYVGDTLDEVTKTISFTLIGNIVISIIAGTVVGIAAWIVGAPFPFVMAVIVGLFDLIPQIGSAIAAFIVCIITLIAEGLPPALALLAVILVYQQVENYLIQPAVMRQAVELSGFATIASVLIGGALLGVVGAVLAVPVAASVKVIVRRSTEPRRARMAALREQAAQPSPNPTTIS